MSYLKKKKRLISLYSKRLGATENTKSTQTHFLSFSLHEALSVLFATPFSSLKEVFADYKVEFMPKVSSAK